jgi:hypothetical protein
MVQKTESILKQRNSMKHLLSFDSEEDNRKLFEIFADIQAGKCLLLLGAGSSIGDKKYLSKEIILYYQERKGIDIQTDDVTDFVDILESTADFNRTEFDTLVFDMLKKLKVQTHHQIMASIPWRCILTTNFDMLIEKANDDIRNTSAFLREICAIRTLQEHNSKSSLSHEETMYFKLNGCISDRSKYPFLFSSSDFENAARYYNSVIKSIKNLSENIRFLAIGHSFSDSFSKRFLKELDQKGNRGKRIVYTVDPYVNDLKLPYLEKQYISVIKLGANDFFKKYKTWESSEYATKISASKGLSISDKNNFYITLPNKLAHKLRYSVNQLGINYKPQSFIPEKDFYLGEEPNYGVIQKSFDIIKTNLLSNVITTIYQHISNYDNRLLPIFFLTGTYGAGKTTFALRLIDKLINDNSTDFLAFELLDLDSYRKEDFIEFIDSIKSPNIIFYANNAENDSIFKAIALMRQELSMHQFDKRIMFFVPIRQNILNVYLSKKTLGNYVSIPTDVALTDPEIDELVDRLKGLSLIEFRDLGEKREIANKIKKDFSSDQYVAYVGLLKHGKHIFDLRDAFFQLQTKECRDAFLFTALLHRYKLYMPSGLLKCLIDKEWDQFKERVIDVEGQGILIQEDLNSDGTDPDLYFKTKHPVIANLLIEEILKTPDDKYEYYRKIFLKIIPGFKTCKLAINLLKALHFSKEFSYEKLNRLYDICYESLSDEPYFLLNYSMNLQYRNTKQDLETALEVLIYGESLLDYRDHKFTHRKGVVNFELAKLYSKEETEYNRTRKYLDDAHEWFKIKQIYDPCSHYSYFDLIKLLLWELNNSEDINEKKLKLMVQIENEIDCGLRNVIEGNDKICELKTEYLDATRRNKSDSEYLESLMVLYNDTNLRPYACILLFNYYQEKEDMEMCLRYKTEMTSYIDINEVARSLFKYYSDRLNFINDRLEFISLIKRADILKDQEELKYNYYMFIAESYNGNFKTAFNYLQNINKINLLNPEYQKIWLETDNYAALSFEGSIICNKHGYLDFKPYDIQHSMRIVNFNKDILKAGMKANANLYFYLNGIRAKIKYDKLEEINQN